MGLILSAAAGESNYQIWWGLRVNNIRIAVYFVRNEYLTLYFFLMAFNFTIKCDGYPDKQSQASINLLSA